MLDFTVHSLTCRAEVIEEPEYAGVHTGSPLARAALATVIVAGAMALVARAFAGIDVRATLRAAGSVGPRAPLLLVPFVAAMALDAAGIRGLLRALGRSVPFSRLLALRIATEALHLTAPVGFVVADSATVTLLDAQYGVPAREGAVLVVARKWLVMRAHAAYLVVGAACGAASLTAVSLRFLGGGGLPWAVGASAVVPLTLSMGLGAGFRGRSALAYVQEKLERVPWPALRARAKRWGAGAVAVDTDLARVGAARSANWRVTAAFFACWILESLETTLILWLVGGPLDLSLALGVEGAISLARSLGNLAPAGFGVQEAGYATLLTGAGMAVDSAAAFVLLKRCKEIVWIAAGYALLAALRVSPNLSQPFSGRASNP